MSFKKILPFIIIVLLSVLGFGLLKYYDISFATIQENRDSLKTFVEQNFILASLGFMALYIVAVALSLPMASPLTISSGFFFGTLLGGSLTIISATIGASIIFLITKSSFGESLRAKTKKNKGLYNRLAVMLEKNQWSALLFVRLVPAFPFFLINILTALFDISLPTFFLSTLIGITPATMVFANIGTQLGTISSLSGLVSRQFLLALAGLGIITLIPVALKKFTKQK